MQFFSPQAFLWFWTLPAVALLFWFSRRLWTKRLEMLGNPATLRQKLMPRYRDSEWQVRMVHLLLVLFLVVLALARPQWGEEKKQVERKGIDVIFMLDTSLSMLAEDIKPSRFEKSKLEIKTFLTHLKGDRVGMVAFAGSGFLQTPLTLDYSAFLLFLDGIKSGYIPDPGTSLNRALAITLQSFPEKSLKHKAIILFTDGEDHEGGLDEALAEVKKLNVRIYALGVGKEEGEPIPLKDEQGRKGGFKKDRAGQIVITKLNQPLLERMAKETGGLYFPATPSEQEVDVILKHMESLGQKKFKEKSVVEREDHYQLFLFFAFLFLAAEMLIRRTQQVAAKPLAVLLCFLLFTGFFKGAGAINEDGNKLFKEKKYQSALESYRKAKVKSPEESAIRYNLATALYQTDQYQEAAKELEAAMASAKEAELKANAHYNYGNTQYRLGNFEKAIEAYQKTLEINPKDKDAKYNLEFLEKQKNLFDKKNEDRKKNEQKEKQQDQQQNQQEQQQDQQQKQDQEQQQQQQQNQDQQQDQQQQQQQNQDQQQEQDQQQNQNQQQQQRQEQEQQSQNQQEQKPQSSQGEEKSEPKEPDQGEEKQPQPEEKEGAGQRREKQPLQGQMSMDNALRLLEALKEGEKELQDLRRPQAPQEGEPQVEKDW